MKRLLAVLPWLLVACAHPAGSGAAPSRRQPTALSAATARPSATAAPTAVPPSPPLHPPTRTPTPPPTATPAVLGYQAHTWAAADTPARWCSSAAQLSAYNRIAALAVGTPMIMPLLANCPPPTGERLLVVRGRPDRPRVALTLDAGGAAAPTPTLLATLRAHHVRVTFFLTGRWMRNNPALVRQIVADGHEVANHSVHHIDFTTLSDDAIIAELRDTEATAAAIAQTTTRPLFRPPFGASNNHVLDVVISQGYLPIYWTLNSLNSVGKPKSVDFLVRRVTETLPPAKLNGAIILMHCGSAPTAAALPTILDRFAAQGIEVTTVSQVLAP